LRKALRPFHAHFEFHDYKKILIVVEANDAAVIIKARANSALQGASFSACLHNPCDFDGRIVELREFMDSFDAVEQVLGREINL
jgi:hypothetical protein